MIRVKKSQGYFKDNTKNAFSRWMDVQDFEILSDVIKRPMHENPQSVSFVVRVDVSSPYLQGVITHKEGWDGLKTWCKELLT